jgi:hypothetical protein
MDKAIKAVQPRPSFGISLPQPKSKSLIFGTHWQYRYLDAAIVRIIGDVKAELSAHGEHHRVFAQHLAPYAL